MTDPGLYFLEAMSAYSAALITYIYVFSGDLRHVIRSANYNFSEWLHGRWSIRTGKGIGSTAGSPAPSSEME